MARIEVKQSPKKKIQLLSLPFTKINYQILAGGILSIVLGYIALAQEPWDGNMPLVVAPILLVLGYCIILFRRKETSEMLADTGDPAEK